MLRVDVMAKEGQERLARIKAAADTGGKIYKAVFPVVRKLAYDELARALEHADESWSDNLHVLAKSSRKDQEDARVIEYVGSTERRDRDEDRILVKGWELKEWKRNPQFLWVHDYHGIPAGAGLKAWKAPDGQAPALKFLILFPQNLPESAQAFVDVIYGLYTSSPPMLRAVSVGFKPLEYQRGETDEDRQKLDIGTYGVLFLKQELWELSGCPIGSNYDALRSRVAKSMGQARTPTILDALGFKLPSGKDFVWISRPENPAPAAADTPAPASPPALASGGIVNPPPAVVGVLPKEVALVLDKLPLPEFLKATEEHVVTKPYENEHAARLKDPDKYDRFRRTNNKFGDGIHAIWGIEDQGEGDPKVELQAIRFNKEKFTAEEAKKWLKENHYKCILFEPAKIPQEEMEARLEAAERDLAAIKAALIEKKILVPASPSGKSGNSSHEEPEEDMPPATPPARVRKDLLYSLTMGDESSGNEKGGSFLSKL